MPVKSPQAWPCQEVTLGWDRTHLAQAQPVSPLCCPPPGQEVAAAGQRCTHGTVQAQHWPDIALAQRCLGMALRWHSIALSQHGQCIALIFHRLSLDLALCWPDIALAQHCISTVLLGMLCPCPLVTSTMAQSHNWRRGRGSSLAPAPSDIGSREKGPRR